MTSSIFEPAPGRVPKCDLDAEAAVLSACVLDLSKCDGALTLLKPADFYSSANRYIFEAILSCATNNIEPDIIAIKSELDKRGRLDTVGGTPYLAQIIDATPAVANVAAHARLVLDAARIRRAGHIAHQFAAEAYGPIGNPQEWLQRFEAAAYEAAADFSVADSAATFGESAGEALEVVKEAAQSKSKTLGYPTGFDDVDNHTGGWSSGDLWIVAGRPGHGKTSWVMQAAESVCVTPDKDGDKGIVVVFSLEMKRRMLLLRALSRRAQVPSRNLQRGRLLPGQWRALVDAVKAAHALPMVIDEGRDLTPYRLRSKIRRHVATLRSKYGSHLKLRAVVIDYLQLMSGNGNADTRAAEIAEITRDLKKAAGELDCAFVALSSLNRPEKSQKSKPPDNSDLRESGAIEFDADIIMMVHQQDKCRPPGEMRDDIADLIFTKARNSGDAHFKKKFDGRYTAFYPEDHVLYPDDSQERYP
jgi:replicative DNA helicase